MYVGAFKKRRETRTYFDVQNMLWFGALYFSFRKHEEE
jgi:hypothetical protein